MSAAEALRLAQENGIRIDIAGVDLILDAEREPAPAVLEALRRHKEEIVALLVADHDGWTAEDWQALFNERAGIAEFDWQSWEQLNAAVKRGSTPRETPFYEQENFEFWEKLVLVKGILHFGFRNGLKKPEKFMPMI